MKIFLVVIAIAMLVFTAGCAKTEKVVPLPAVSEPKVQEPITQPEVQQPVQPDVVKAESNTSTEIAPEVTGNVVAEVDVVVETNPDSGSLDDVPVSTDPTAY